MLFLFVVLVWFGFVLAYFACCLLLVTCVCLVAFDFWLLIDCYFGFCCWLFCFLVDAWLLVYVLCIRLIVL